VRRSEQDIEDELLTIREAIVYEKEVVSGSYLALWKDPSVRKRLLLAFVINAGQQLSGQGTLNQYSSTIYKKIWKSQDTINLINALNATCGSTYLPDSFVSFRPWYASLTETFRSSLHTQRFLDRRSIWTKANLHRRCSWHGGMSFLRPFTSNVN
jgi:hypothetical protein